MEKNRVYYTSNRGELICADILGFHDQENDGPFREEKNVNINDVDVIWKIDMKKKFHIHKRDASDHFNPTSSPLIHGDYLYCVTGHSRRLGDLSARPSPPSFLAVNKMTGKLLWSSNAPGKNIIHAQWSSPVMINVAGQMQVIFPGGDGCLYGFHPESGRQLWKFDCNKPRKIDPTKNKPDRRGFYFPTPVVRKETIFVGICQGMAPLSSSNFPLYSLKLNWDGKNVTPTINWVIDEKRFFGTWGTVAIYNDVLFTTTINGYLIALNATSGREVWRYDLLDGPSAWGSPYVFDGKLFVATHHEIFVFKASAKMECLGQYVFHSLIRGTPISDGKKLYVTTDSHVWALRLPD